MYLKLTSDFIKFLGNREHSIEEVLAYVVLRAMAPLQATSASISLLDNQNTMVTVGKFGFPSAVQTQYKDSFTLIDRIPMTDALRQRKIVVVDTLPSWPRDYPLLSEVPYPSHEVSMICFPIERCETPIAVGTIFFTSQFFLDENTALYIESISNLLALYLYSSTVRREVKSHLHSESLSTHEKERGLPLSQRQGLILQMISEGRTNLVIGEMLKYSESTIRQETIKIFSKLGCAGRAEATNLYKNQELEN